MVAVINEASAYIRNPVTLTSGRAGLSMSFEFSEEWDGLTKTAVFTCGELTPRYVIIVDNEVIIPAEVMTAAGYNLICGVYGTDGDAEIIPTIYFSLGTVQQGAEITGQEPGEITQTLYNQVVALLTDASETLDDIKETAIKEADADDTGAATVGTPSVTVDTEWIDEDDHSLGKKATFIFKNLKGRTGVSIDRITKTATVGLVDTYTIYYDDDQTTTFEVTNGAAGVITEVTASVDSKIGTPSVNVTLGGTGNQRTIDLAFHNLKGHDGKGSGDMTKDVYDPDGGYRQVAFANDVNAIANKIPAQASSSNQLADKDFVNSSIENVAAYYITKDAAGNAFATKAELTSATTFYSGGAVRVPTRNDYCVVLADESKTIEATGEDPTTRYIYDNNTWSYQYIVNRSGLTAAQWATVNSGLTSAMLPSGVSSSDKLVKHSELPTSSTYADFMTVITQTWIGEEAPYTQEITVVGMLASDKPTVDLVPNSTFSTVEQEIADYGKIYDIQTYADKIVVYATETTETDITIQMRCIR